MRRVIKIHTSVFHDSDTICDGASLRAGIKKSESLAEFAEVLEHTDVVKQNFRVLYVIIWDVLLIIWSTSES